MRLFKRGTVETRTSDESMIQTLLSMGYEEAKSKKESKPELKKESKQEADKEPDCGKTIKAPIEEGECPSPGRCEDSVRLRYKELLGKNPHHFKSTATVQAEIDKFLLTQNDV